MTAPIDLVSVSAALLERLAALGVRVPEAIRRAGLVAARFEAPRARLTTREFFAFWSAVEQEVPAGARDLGLVLGAQALALRYDVGSMAALHAPNLGDALKKLGRYKRLVCPEQVEVEVARTEASIRFHWILADADMPRLLVDATFASLVALARRGTGTPVVPLRVELARRRSDAALLAAHFGCEVSFAAPFDRIVFSEATLALPFVTRDADALAVVIPGLESALGEVRGTRTLRDEVRVAIARHLCGERPAVEKIARVLGVSPRTLQRRLGEEGTSYQEQLDEVRQKTARRLLANTDLDAVEVAFFLGFEEPNSFARAFRGWEGTSPGRFREASPRAIAR